MVLAERRARRRERRRAPRPVLGDPRRRRQLRRRHVVPVPAARGRHDHRRSDLLAGRAGRRGALGVPRVHARRAARAERLLRVRHRAAGAAVPRGDPPAQGVRRRVVLRRRPRRTRRRRWPRCWTPCPSRSCTDVQPMPHPALQSAFDALYPTGDQWYWRADFVNEIPDEAVEIHAKFGAEMPTMKSTMHLYPIDGAAHDVAPSDTAWSYRDAKWGAVFAGVDPDPANVGAIRRLEQRLPRGAPPVLGRRRLREHDDGRGAGAGPRELPRQLRPAGRASRAPTTRTTCSGSTRTSSRPHEPLGRGDREVEQRPRGVVERDLAGHVVLDVVLVDDAGR